MSKINKWSPFNNGECLGSTGTENGIIIQDDEHSIGARITLEKDGHAPYGITCGVYGFGFLTTFASTDKEAIEKYETMKTELDSCLNYICLDEVSEDEAHSALCVFFEQYG